MARRKITNSQAVCLTLLWGVLAYMLLVYSEEITFDVIFALVASAIIVFVPVYKNIKRRNERHFVVIASLKCLHDIFLSFFLSNICWFEKMAYLCDVLE